MSTLSERPNVSYERRQETIHFFAEVLDENLTVELVQIPVGSFTMGSPRTEPERKDAEGPQHEVRLDEFFMGQYPITQAQWRFVAKLPQIDQPLETNPSRFQRDNHPVEQVSWYDAIEFCKRLSVHTGRKYDLPTEAEWEYACRAGTTTPFHFGETISPDVANYQATEAYNNGPTSGQHRKTTPVDHFGVANAFGLCDMHGNVWEWCQDHWHDNYEGAPIDGSAWLKGLWGDSKVVRGGSWSFNPGMCRSASRTSISPNTRLNRLGFRLVCLTS